MWYIAKQKYIICSEDEYKSLNTHELRTIRFVVGKSNTFIKPGTVYVADKTLRGPIAESILKFGKFIRKIPITNAMRNQIRRDFFPNFNLTTFEQYSFEWPSGYNFIG